MTPREQGFLLLTSHLGNPERRPLTAAKLRTLAQRVQTMEAPAEDRELAPEDLTALGYGREGAEEICRLLSERELLEYYLRLAKNQDIFPVTRVSPGYPALLRRRLGLDSPGCLWCRGDGNLLNRPAVSLVGSRELREENARFAREAGIQAAKQGLTLISGNARGADRTAQEACLEAGGSVISIVADELTHHPERDKVLYVSEDGFSEPFSAQRAHSRNRIIHALGRMVLVAQTDLEKGGTWQGTAANLKHGWSCVACFRDGSPGSLALEGMGAFLFDREDLCDLGQLPEEDSLFTR